MLLPNQLEAKVKTSTPGVRKTVSLCELEGAGELGERSRVLGREEKKVLLQVNIKY